MAIALRYSVSKQPVIRFNILFFPPNYSDINSVEIIKEIGYNQ